MVFALMLVRLLLRLLLNLNISHVIREIRVSSGTALSLIVSAACPCDDLSCVEMRATVATVKWLFPTWCAEFNATIRLRSRPVQIVIQTPIARIVCSSPASLACCLSCIGRACAYSCSVQECAARGADAVSARANANARAYVSALRVS